MEMTKAICVACRHAIDEAARLCPYCGADPRTGEKIDTQAILHEVFHPREISATEGVLEFARQRQGVMIAVAALVAILLLGAVHQFVVRRNQSAVKDAAAVPLTDVADLSNQPEETPLPMPQLQYQFDGHPQTMRTYIVEPGAVTPAEVVAAQQQPQPAHPPAQ
jgi:hypothetical protein